MTTDQIRLKYWQEMAGYEAEGFKFHLVSLESFIIDEVTYKIFPSTRFIITDYIVKFGEVINFKTKWNEMVTEVLNADD